MHDGYSLAKTESGSPAPGEHARPEEPQDEYTDMPFTDLKRRMKSRGLYEAFAKSEREGNIMYYEVRREARSWLRHGPPMADNFATVQPRRHGHVQAQLQSRVEHTLSAQHLHGVLHANEEDLHDAYLQRAPDGTHMRNGGSESNDGAPAQSSQPVRRAASARVQRLREQSAEAASKLRAFRESPLSSAIAALDDGDESSSEDVECSQLSQGDVSSLIDHSTDQDDYYEKGLEQLLASQDATGGHFRVLGGDSTPEESLGESSSSEEELGKETTCEFIDGKSQSVSVNLYKKVDTESLHAVIVHGWPACGSRDQHADLGPRPLPAGNY
jgi:hypothetical protein